MLHRHSRFIPTILIVIHRCCCCRRCALERLHPQLPLFRIPSFLYSLIPHNFVAWHRSCGEEKKCNGNKLRHHVKAPRVEGVTRRTSYSSVYIIIIIIIIIIITKSCQIIILNIRNMVSLIIIHILISTAGVVELNFECTCSRVNG